MALENSAGCPTSKEGGSFIVDLVLKEFLLCVLPIALFPPPTHFHLKTNNTVSLLTFLSSFVFFTQTHDELHRHLKDLWFFYPPKRGVAMTYCECAGLAYMSSSSSTAEIISQLIHEMSKIHWFQIIKCEYLLFFSFQFQFVGSKWALWILGIFHNFLTFCKSKD